MSAIGKLNPDLLGHVLSFLKTTEVAQFGRVSHAAESGVENALHTIANPDKEPVGVLAKLNQACAQVFPASKRRKVEKTADDADAKPDDPAKLYSALDSCYKPTLLRQALSSENMKQQLTREQINYFNCRLKYLERIGTQPAGSIPPSQACHRNKR